MQLHGKAKVSYTINICRAKMSQENKQYPLRNKKKKAEERAAHTYYLVMF